MAKITLKGVPPFDGEYDFDPGQEYNGHELHLIKKVADVRLAEIEDAAKAGDYDLFVSLAVIALWRAGKIQRDETMVTAEVLLGAVTGCLTFDFQGDDQKVPLEQQPSGDEPDSKLGENSKPSPETSSGVGDNLPEKIPEPIGLPG